MTEISTLGVTARFLLKIIINIKVRDLGVELKPNWGRR
jgi:hypothetical protein